MEKHAEMCSVQGGRDVATAARMTTHWANFEFNVATRMMENGQTVDVVCVAMSVILTKTSTFYERLYYTVGDLTTPCRGDARILSVLGRRP